MTNLSEVDYSRFDRPEILMVLFHPRPEWHGVQSERAYDEILIPVEKEEVVGARFYPAGASCPNILFFHGNGEIVADYDDIGQLYRRMEINFLPVDYRGYGRSTGRPTISAMMRDSHVILGYVKNWLSENGYGGPVIVMGRSLGSASALEIAYYYGGQIEGLIIESGFAYVRPLMELLGINMEALGIREEEGFQNVEKIRIFGKPTLIIHAEKDHIIPFAQGKALYEASSARNKRLLEIRGADHNDIFVRGMQEYMGAVEALIKKIC